VFSSDLSPSANTVVNLVSRLREERHHIFVDNLYNSVPLMRFMWDTKHTYFTGTYRPNYTLPSALIRNQPKESGVMAAVVHRSGNFSVTMAAIRDTKLFYFSTSYGFPLEFKLNARRKWKYWGVDAYNNNKVRTSPFLSFSDKLFFS